MINFRRSRAGSSPALFFGSVEQAIAISYAVGRWTEVAVEEAGDPELPGYLCSNHILVETEEEANAALLRFIDGETFADLADFRTNLADFLASDGPAMAVLKIEPGDPHPRDYAYIHSPEARHRFRQALNGGS